ncbi:hypothetical protein AURDEDRAFT_167810 [Auricularia subglabra TFB-10046 SS5]|nr:hypothetical protein AURDEDRAFT_167810 [Auricularia subglabra TFB-10046 SS5]
MGSLACYLTAHRPTAMCDVPVIAWDAAGNFDDSVTPDQWALAVVEMSTTFLDYHKRMFNLVEGLIQLLRRAKADVVASGQPYDDIKIRMTFLVQRRGRQALNKEFKYHAEKIAEAGTKSNGEEMEVDIPFADMAFEGVPSRANVKLYPTMDCLVHLSDPPFMVVTLSNIEIASLERVQFGLRLRHCGTWPSSRWDAHESMQAEASKGSLRSLSHQDEALVF